MPYGSVSNYRGLVGDIIEQGYDVFYEIYNNTGAAIANGAVYKVVFAADGTTGNYPTVAATATDSAGISLICVVNNGVLNNGGGTGIPTTSWGYVQTRGECPTVNVSNATTIGHALDGSNAAQTCADSGAATIDAKAFAIARSSTTGAGSVSATLLGFRVQI